MKSRIFVVLVLALCVAASASDSGPASGQPTGIATGSKKQEKLTWARGVADDFIAAWIGGKNAEAEMLVTEALKERYAKYPQCTQLASQLLDVQYAGLSAGAITDEQISPREDEARFTGKLTGERNNKPIEADFSLRVVEESGKWRISFFRQQWRWIRPDDTPGK